MTVQGHPKSKVMVSIDSPWMTSYSTSINPIIVSVTTFTRTWQRYVRVFAVAIPSVVVCRLSVCLYCL